MYILLKYEIETVISVVKTYTVMKSTHQADPTTNQAIREVKIRIN